MSLLYTPVWWIRVKLMILYGTAEIFMFDRIFGQHVYIIHDYNDKGQCIYWHRKNKIYILIDRDKIAEWQPLLSVVDCVRKGKNMGF